MLLACVLVFYFAQGDTQIEFQRIIGILISIYINKYKYKDIEVFCLFRNKIEIVGIITEGCCMLSLFFYNSINTFYLFI